MFEFVRKVFQKKPSDLILENISLSFKGSRCNDRNLASINYSEKEITIINNLVFHRIYTQNGFNDDLVELFFKNTTSYEIKLESKATPGITIYFESERKLLSWKEKYLLEESRKIHTFKIYRPISNDEINEFSNSIIGFFDIYKNFEFSGMPYKIYVGFELVFENIEEYDMFKLKYV